MALWFFNGELMIGHKTSDFFGNLFLISIYSLSVDLDDKRDCCGLVYYDDFFYIHTVLDWSL